MTKAEIIDAAFKVWGRELYLNTSLSHVARELKVCKPALYRHFRSKDALLEAMTHCFFDNFADFIRADHEKALQTTDNTQKIFILIHAFAEYYARNTNLFIFSMIKIHNRKLDNFDKVAELRARGIDIAKFQDSIKKDFVFQPLILRLINTTLTFYMAVFHKKEESLTNSPSEAAITKIIDKVSEIIGHGLCYSNEEIDSLDYNKLESRIVGTVSNIEDDPLLKAVAGAVAEAGPWEASMEQVARRSGLSKSSLYCHYESKQDMLHQLFRTEYLRINDFARHGIQQSNIPQEQLYLGIFSIVEYLRAKPDILVALDWVRNRKVDLDDHQRRQAEKKPEFQPLFEEIDNNFLQNSTDLFNGELWLSPWILFLVINTLMQSNSGEIMGNVPNSDIRYLYRFLTLGIGGFRT